MTQVFEVSITDVREKLRKLEAANEELCRVRSREVYLSMIDDGQADALYTLDATRRKAREICHFTNSSATKQQVFAVLRELIDANKALIRMRSANLFIAMTKTAEQENAVANVDIALFVANSFLAWDEECPA